MTLGVELDVNPNFHFANAIGNVTQFVHFREYSIPYKVKTMEAELVMDLNYVGFFRNFSV